MVRVITTTLNATIIAMEAAELCDSQSTKFSIASPLYSEVALRVDKTFWVDQSQPKLSVNAGTRLDYQTRRFGNPPSIRTQNRPFSEVFSGCGMREKLDGKRVLGC